MDKKVKLSLDVEEAIFLDDNHKELKYYQYVLHFDCNGSDWPIYFKVSQADKKALKMYMAQKHPELDNSNIDNSLIK